ncbi:uncharacterized protein [Nicotiana tomentosiformis]|uniref:uncharacterized protein n=1 Tax=Nicotiana tomentosiformis TaxID=4098 RepID=UPI00388CA2D9
MAVTTRSGRGGDTPTSSQRKLVDDKQVVEEEEIPNNVVQANDEVRIDIDDNVGETQEEVTPSRDHIIDILEPVVQKAKASLLKPPPLYPRRLAKKNGENQFKKFIYMMKSLSINVSLVEALEQMPGYAKFMKDLVIKKRSMNFETIKVTHQVSAIVRSMAPKLEDPSAFTIPCTIGSAEFDKALCDLGQPNSNEVCSFMDLVTDVIIDDTSATINVGDMLDAVLLNFDDDEMDGFMECVNSLQGMGSYNYAPRKHSLDLENRKTPPTKPSN